MAKVRHLHKNYNESFCGKDISNMLATYALEGTTCDECKEAAEAAVAKSKDLKEKLNAAEEQHKSAQEQHDDFHLEHTNIPG